MSPALAPPHSDREDELVPSLRKLASMGVRRKYRKGTLLIQEGELGDTVYIVLSGRLRAFVSDARGREATLTYHGRGDYVGEMSLDGGPRSASVEVVEAAECATLTRETVLRHIAEEPEFAMALIVRLIQRARLATQSARSMALLDVYGRLKRLLDERSTAQADGTRIVQPRPTHHALAQEIGCSREMVSRLIKDLERGQYVRVHPNHLLLSRETPSHW